MRLSAIQKCHKCGEGLAASRLPIIVRFEVQSECFDEQAIRRANGMEQLMGVRGDGSPDDSARVAIARAMGTDDVIAKPHENGPLKGYLCMQCAMTVTVGELAADSVAPTAPKGQGEPE